MGVWKDGYMGRGKERWMNGRCTEGGVGPLIYRYMGVCR